MTTRNHNNRSEKQKGHVPDRSDEAVPKGHSKDAGHHPHHGDGGGGVPKTRARAKRTRERTTASKTAATADKYISGVTTCSYGGFPCQIRTIRTPIPHLPGNQR